MIENNIGFIIYDARSGSTFLSNLLLKYSLVAIPPESNIVTNLIEYLQNKIIENKKLLHDTIEFIFNESKFQDWNIKKEVIFNYFKNRLPIEIKDLILGIFFIFKKINYPKSRYFLLKKAPVMNYYQYIKDLFPYSKFIGIIRDGRAIFNSKKRSYSSHGEHFETNPFKSAKKWCKILKTFSEIKKEYPNSFLSIYYENLIRNPKKTIEKIANFLKIDLYLENPFKNRFYQIPKRYGKNLHKNINKKPIKKRIFNWKNTLSLDEILAFESIAYKFLLKYNYDLIFPLNYLKNKSYMFRLKIKHLKWWYQYLFFLIYDFIKQKIKFKISRYSLNVYILNLLNLIN